MTEGTLVFVDGVPPQHGLQVAPAAVDQAGGDDVLDPRAGVGSCNPHQRLQIVGEEGHSDGRHQGDERKHHAVHHPRVGAAIAVEQRLPVVAERHGDDGEVGADGEDREQAQEVAQHRDVQDVAVVREVEGVHVVQQRAVEAEDGGEGQQHVEAQDQDVVGQHQYAHSLLVGDRRHQRRQGVLAHEGVHTHPKQVGNSGQRGGRWVALAGAFTDAEES